MANADSSSSSPFRTFDRIQENRVADDFVNRSIAGRGPMLVQHRSQSAERQKKKNSVADLSGSSGSATLTRGFHLPNTSKSLWQRVFVGGGGGSHANNAGSMSMSGLSSGSGPESLPCSWSLESPPATLKHIKQ